MKKTEIIHVAVEPDMRKMLKQLAHREGLSVSVIIRQAIRNHLEVMRRWIPAEGKAR